MRHRPHRPLLSILIVFLAVGWTGCSDGASRSPKTIAQNASVVEDGLGRKITISKPVKRIVSLAPGATEIIFAAGGLEFLVGVTTADDFPDAVKELPSFSALPLNFESVIGLKPDLIFASSQVNNPDDAHIFEQVGIPVYFLRSNSLEQILSGIRSVGSILSTAEVAEATADALAIRIAVLESVVVGLTHKPKVLTLLSSTDLYSFGARSYVHDLIRLGGGESITAQLDQDAVILNEEFIISERPDVIIGTFSAETKTSDFLINHRQWTNVPAILNNRIFAIESNLILRPGPRNVDAAEAILSFLQPDLLLVLKSDSN